VRKLVGRNLRLYRAQAGISQEELAHRAGLDRTYVSGIERGVRNPTVLVLKDLADTVGVSPAALLSPPVDAGGRVGVPRKLQLIPAGLSDARSRPKHEPASRENAGGEVGAFEAVVIG